MNKIDNLKVGADGNSYYFTENPELVDLLQKMYPKFKFHATLSLTKFPQRNLHQLKLSLPFTKNINVIQAEVTNAMFDFLDKATIDMMQHGYQSATVHLSSLEIGSVTDSSSLKTEMYANFRACFIPDEN